MKVFSESSIPRLSADLASRLDLQFREALDEGYFSGAGASISAGGAPVLERYWGLDRRGGVPIEPSTRFDLASLTKPLVTVPLLMNALSRRTVGLDDTLPRFFGAAAPSEKREITLRHLLSHSSGLAPYRQFFYELVKVPPEERRDTLVSLILKDPLEAAPGTRAAYSDLGFILLGAILERILGGRLDTAANEIVFAPLGIDELHFCPINVEAGPEMPIRRIFEWGEPHLKFAAAEFCPWRKRLLVGEVSDENAWSLGGVAAHAGLFGTARGVFRMISFLRDVYRGKAGHPLFSPETVRLFWTRAGVPEGGAWTLGFDTPSAEGSSAGRYFSKNSVGHLGFTGTSFWLDLDRDILVVLLTNRVHPSRENDAFKKFRPAVHDTVMEVLTDAI